MRCDYGHEADETRLLPMLDGQSIYVCGAHFAEISEARTRSGMPCPAWPTLEPRACIGTWALGMELPAQHAQRGDEMHERCTDGTHVRAAHEIWRVVQQYELDLAEMCHTFCRLLAEGARHQDASLFHVQQVCTLLLVSIAAEEHKKDCQNHDN